MSTTTTVLNVFLLNDRYIRERSEGAAGRIAALLHAIGAVAGRPLACSMPAYFLTLSRSVCCVVVMTAD